MTHWRSTSRNPHDKTTAAFLLTGHELLLAQEGEPLPLWIPPQEIETIAPEFRRYWQLQNPSLQRAEDFRRATATAKVDKIVRKNLVGKYDHPDVKAVIDDLMHLQQVATKELYDLAEEKPDIPTIQPANAIIYFVKSALRQAHPQKTENALNDAAANLMSRGIPTGEATSYGLNRNHIRRGEQAFNESLRRIVNRFDDDLKDAILRAQFEYWNERVDVLLALEAGAAKQPRFRGLSGKTLALAIDHHPGMLTAFLRQSRRQAA